MERISSAYTETPDTYLETQSYATPQQLTACSNQFNLKLASMYCSGQFIDPALVDAEIQAILVAARFVRSAGCRHLVIGGGMNSRGRYEDDDYARLVTALHTIGRGCRDFGITACYHPHSGTMVETAAQLERFCAETDPSLIALAPDVAHLVRGGADPVETIRRYSDRIQYVHLKDIKDDEFVELGEGTVDLPGVVATLKDIGFSGWAVVELDDTTRTPLESAAISYRYLRDRLDVAPGHGHIRTSGST